MRVLQNLEPSLVFQYFEEICGIPHTSYNEKQLSDYCVAFAKEHGYAYEQDSIGNVIIFAPATRGYEHVEPIILQGHLDMVGDKTADCPLDLEKDGLQLSVDRYHIRAKGTTLGADNGIAIAYALAILSDNNIPHPPLEVVFTVREEVGLIGATYIDLSSCKAKRMLNMDSEDEGILMAGCAGGIRVLSKIPVDRSTKRGHYCTLTLSGLLGGHSGLEIHKGRVNAIVTLGRILQTLDTKTTFGIVGLVGGTKPNVIPKDSKATLIVPAEELENFKATVAQLQADLSAEFGTVDPNLTLLLDIDESEEEVELILDNNSQKRVLAMLNLIPNGVQSMSADLPGLVETSMNTGVLALTDDGDHLIVETSIRSSVPTAKFAFVEKVQQLASLLMGYTETSGDYPAWPYARESKLRDLCIKLYKDQYDEEPQVDIMHAGLECGIFSAKIPGLDCISIGPNLKDVHSPNEHLSISSVQRVWEYIKGNLAAK